MDLSTFISKVVDQGIEAAQADYTKPEQAQELKGSLDGFEQCRGKNPNQLRDLLLEANTRANDAFREEKDYWFFRCRALEIEWVCNCVSAVLVNEGMPPLAGMLPTCRGVMKVHEILASEFLQIHDSNRLLRHDGLWWKE
jgi:hypothetical protein